MEEMKNAYKILFGEPQGKRQLCRCRRSSDDNIKMDVGCGTVSTDSRYRPMAGFCEHGYVPSGSTKTKNFLTST
jgi:hypothetical protein